MLQRMSQHTRTTTHVQAGSSTVGMGPSGPLCPPLLRFSARICADRRLRCADLTRSMLCDRISHTLCLSTHALYTTDFRAVHSLRFVILLFWTLALGVSIYLGPQFLKNTKNTFEAPKGTPAYEATELWQQLFHGDATGHSLIVLMASSQNESLTEPGSPGFVQALHVDTTLRATLLNRTEAELDHAKDYTGIQSYFSVLTSVVPSLATQLVSSDGRDMLFEINFRPTKDGGGGGTTGTIVKTVRDLVQSLNSDRFTLGVTGGDALDVDIGTTANKDFEHNDAIILPIALFVLMLYLKSLRLMILPILCVALSLFGSLAIMLPVAKFCMDVASFAPSIMASLTVAMSIDYNLFLLTRFREEILSGLHGKETDAIRATVRSSGEVILASGLTLAITFASLAAFPMNFLASIGIGACTTILVCVVVNLTFTPAMLCIFPRFFSNFTILSCLRTILPRAYTRDCPELPFGSEGLDAAFLPTPLALNSGSSSVMGRSQMNKELLYDEDSPTSAVEQASPTVVSSVRYNRMRDPFEVDKERRDAYLAPIPATSLRNFVGVVDDDGSDASEQARARARARVSTPRVARMREEQAGSFWYKSAVFSTTTPISVLLILIVLGASVPFFMACLQMEHTIDQNQLLPKSSDAYKVLQQVQNDFSPGIISAYHVLVTADNSLLPGWNASAPAPLMPLLTPEYFDFTVSIVEAIFAQQLVTNNSLISVVYAFNRWTRTVEEAEALVLGPCPGQESSCIYMTQLKEALNDGFKSVCSQISLDTPFPPLSDKAEPFVKSVRDILAVAQTLSNERYGGAFQVYLTGGATSAIDAVNRIFELFPIILAVTVGVVLVLVSLLFRSLVVPLRLVVTLAIPLAFTYGLAVMVFQQHKVNADWISSQIRDNNAIYWIVPVMAFSILIGLGLDYDLFLSLRIREFRLEGFSTTAAVRKGIYHTGSIITGAGLIMGIAFFGLMLSSTMCLLEFGFMLCFAVILDTFVIRTIFMPAIMHLLGEANWWPSRSAMPEPNKTDLDQAGDEGAERSDEYSFR